MLIFWDGGRKIDPKDSHFGPSCSKRLQLNELVKGHFVNCFSGFNIVYFDIFCWKIVSALLLHCKSYSHFFSKKFQHICVSLNVNFNKSLTNDIVSFEQLGPGLYWSVKLFLQSIKSCEIGIKMRSLNYFRIFFVVIFAPKCTLYILSKIASFRHFWEMPKWGSFTG